MWNLTNSRYIHRERLSPFFPVSFSHWHCKIDNIKIVLVLLFIFLFTAFNNFKISSSLKNENGRVPCLCHTSSTRKTFQSSNSNQQQKHLKMQEKNCLCGQRCLFSFHFTVPSFKEIFDTVKISKQSDFGVSKVYKNSFWKTG